MLLANMTAASTVAAAFPDRALLRCHPPPLERGLESAANSLRSMVGSLTMTRTASVRAQQPER